MRRLAMAVTTAGVMRASDGGSSNAAGSSHAPDALAGGWGAMRP